MRTDLLPTSYDAKVARVIEEAAEVLKCIGKMQRFGKQAQDPVTKIKYDNEADLREELTHLKHSIEQLEAWYNI